jgi:P4 family phage/plasmid primase-like protien
MSTNKLPDAALFYAQRLSWAVFPLKPEAKTPATAHGFKDASRDADTIRAWWQRTPNANIGLCTGDVFVLDFDAHKPDYAGAELLDMLLEDYPTATADTARGGVHLFFAQRPGLQLTNASGSLPKGVDVRGHGGYVALAPSVFAWDGQTGVYRWRADLEPWNVQLAPLPLFVADLILAPSEAGKRPDGERADDVIATFNQAHRLTDILTAHGYQVGRASGQLTRLARPGKPAGETSIVVAAVNGVERSYHHSTSDALCTNGHARDAFDVWTQLEHGGDAKQAYRAAKQAQGKWTDPKPKGSAPATNTPATPGNGYGEDGYAGFLSDLGNGARLARQHGRELRFVDAWGWLHWDGTRWQMDVTGEVMRRAKRTAITLFEEGTVALQQAQIALEKLRDSVSEDTPKGDRKRAQEEVEKQLKKASDRMTWALKSQERPRLDAMIALAKSEPPIPARAADFDADPWLLNVQNGVLNLRTGELMPHAPERLCSRFAPVSLNADAQCPTWHAFLHRIFAEDAELIDYLQRWLGYCLTGQVSEQYLHALWGSGANGKSVLIGTMLALLGDYGATAAPELLLTRDGKHPTEVADLQGRRFVCSVETDDGRRLAEAAVKSLTGGDKVKARRMYENFWEFSPTHKLALVTNHKPKITGTDHAIWRRLRLIPFEVTIPDAEQDKALPAKLQAELPGILAWAVRGCLEWQRRGLDAPEKVRTATATYKAESDHLASFLAECVKESPGDELQARVFYQAYVAWCDDNGQKPQNGTAFGLRLGERGFDKYVHPRTTRTYYLNVALEV